MNFEELDSFKLEWKKYMDDRNSWIQKQEPDIQKYLVWDPLHAWQMECLASQFYYTGRSNLRKEMK